MNKQIIKVGHAVGDKKNKVGHAVGDKQTNKVGHAVGDKQTNKVSPAEAGSMFTNKQINKQSRSCMEYK